MLPATGREYSEFVHYIAANGYTADLFNKHLRSADGTACRSCEHSWPCNMRQVAEQALRLLHGKPPTPNPTPGDHFPPRSSHAPVHMTGTGSAPEAAGHRVPAGGRAKTSSAPGTCNPQAVPGAELTTRKCVLIWTRR